MILLSQQISFPSPMAQIKVARIFGIVDALPSVDRLRNGLAGSIDAGFSFRSAVEVACVLHEIGVSSGG